jgi:hypothetical protein
MKTKRISSAVATVLLVFTGAVFAASPAPRVSPGSVSTLFMDNVIVANVGIAMPVGCWTNTLVYAPAVSPAQGTQLTWAASAGAVGYAVYFGDVFQSTTNKFDVAYSTGAVFFGLSSNTLYFFYVTAYDTTRVESPPSALVLFRPGS